MFNTIKSKFIILSLVVIILSIGIPVGFLLDQVSRNFHDRSVIMVEATIDLLIDGLNESMMIGDQKNVQKIVEQVSDKVGIEHIRLFDKEGKIKYSNRNEELGLLVNEVEPGHIEKPISEITDREVFLDRDTRVYKAIEPVFIEERCQSCHKDNRIISYLDIDTDFTQAEMTYYTGSVHMVFLGIALIIILGAGFYFLFNQFINKPLGKFIFALDSVESGNLEIKLPVQGKDEFSTLNYHFNRMVNELKYSRNKIDELHFDQLQRADKMVTLGELTASMAHDINNHSAIIMSRADYLLYKAEEDGFTSHCVGDLEVINDQIEKISKITGNILKHSKKLSSKFIDVNLNTLVQNTIEMLQPIIKKNEIGVDLNLSVEEIIIKADPNQIEQVLLNLISNAIDAMQNEGKLKISAQHNNDNAVELIVEDNGSGIDEESLKMIFSPFYTNKESDKGTGLGLYIVENICKNHKADIKCESELNVGTKFIITFSGGIDD